MSNVAKRVFSTFLHAVSKKVPSASLGQLDFYAGQVTLAYLSSKQG